jgi:hypothetical protein
MPSSVVRTLPTTALPVTAGGVALIGACSTVTLLLDAAVTVSCEFDRVTSHRMTAPTSRATVV